MNENDDRNHDDELMVRAARLDQSVRPARDLWPGIAAAIQAPLRPARSVWSSVWAQAAAVLLLVGGSSGLTYMAVNDSGNATTPSVMERPMLVFEPVSGSFGSQYNLGPDYQDARRDLAANLESELDRLEPETRAEVVTNLETIKQAIEDINKELADEPDNVLLQELLLNTYRDELALMMKVDEISSAAMRRDDI